MSVRNSLTHAKWGKTASEATSPVVDSTVQFSQTSYIVGEGDQRVNLTVTRSGDLSGTATVNYATIDDAGFQNCDFFNGIASPRCDYLATTGTLSFAAGETSKSFSVAMIDDSYAEGSELFRVLLSNPSGASLGTTSIATVIIIDNDIVTGPGGKQILLEDPSGNPVELFEPTRPEARLSQPS